MGSGRPERVGLLEWALEIQAMADLMRAEAKRQLAEELAAEQAEKRRQANAAELNAILADTHIALNLASAMKFVGWRLAGRAERVRVETGL